MQRLPLPPFDVPRTITMLTFTATPTPTADEAIGCHIHSSFTAQAGQAEVHHGSNEGGTHQLILHVKGGSIANELVRTHHLNAWDQSGNTTR